MIFFYPLNQDIFKASLSKLPKSAIIESFIIEYG